MTSCVVISSQLSAWPNRIMSFKDHLSTSRHMTGLYKQTGWQWCLAIVNRLLKGPSINDENCALPLCVYVGGFGKSGHIHIGSLLVYVYVSHISLLFLWLLQFYLPSLLECQSILTGLLVQHILIKIS